MGTLLGQENLGVLHWELCLAPHWEGEMRDRRFRATSAVARENDSPGASNGEASEKGLGTSATRKPSVRADAWAAPRTLADGRRAGRHREPIRDTRPNAVLLALKRTISTSAVKSN